MTTGYSGPKKLEFELPFANVRINANFAIIMAEKPLYPLRQGRSFRV
jgi:hypothetical protein